MSTKQATAIEREGGGGNTIQGRMVEEFRVDVRALPGFSEVVIPALQKTTQLVPGYARLLESVIDSGPIWYLVPVALKDLPSKITGLNFVSDQVAVQHNREIWIDQKKFSVMQITSQGMLLLHELVMATLSPRFVNAEGHRSTREIVTIISSRHSTTSAHLKSLLASVGLYYLTSEEKQALEIRAEEIISYYVPQIANLCARGGFEDASAREALNRIHTELIDGVDLHNPERLGLIKDAEFRTAEGLALDMLYWRIKRRINIPWKNGKGHYAYCKIFEETF